METPAVADRGPSGKHDLTNGIHSGARPGPVVRAGRTHPHREQLQVHRRHDRIHPARKRLHPGAHLVRPKEMVWSALGKSVGAVIGKKSAPKQKSAWSLP